MEKQEKRIRLYYVRAEASRNYMATDMMESLNNEEDLDKHYDVPTTMDMINDYVCVADFPADEVEIPERMMEAHDVKNEINQLLEALFYHFNHVDYEGVTAEMASQEFIREQRLHTSMMIGDVIRIDDEFFYVDGAGFKKFNPERAVETTG